MNPDFLFRSCTVFCTHKAAARGLQNKQELREPGFVYAASIQQPSYQLRTADRNTRDKRRIPRATDCVWSSNINMAQRRKASHLHTSIFVDPRARPEEVPVCSTWLSSLQRRDPRLTRFFPFKFWSDCLPCVCDCLPCVCYY